MATSFTVLTYNIHHGEGWMSDRPAFTGFADLERIARVIRDSGADVIALQEVDRWHRRSGIVDQPAVLADLLEMSACFGRNVSWPDGGEHGVATFSRYPIVSQANTRFPRDSRLEPRGVLKVVIDIPGAGEVVVLNTHLQIADGEFEEIAKEERQWQAARIAKMIRPITAPVILMGDFNAEPGDEELAPLGALRDAWSVNGDRDAGRTIPGHPMLVAEKRIDLVYVNEYVQVRSAKVMTGDDSSLASDHLPVVVELSLA